MTSANTGSAIGSDSIAPPIVTSDGSSHCEMRIHPSSASAAGITLRHPRKNVARTSHHGSGCARSKRRTKKSQARERRNGIPVPAMTSGQSVGTRVAEVRAKAGRGGDARIAASARADANAARSSPRVIRSVPEAIGPTWSAVRSRTTATGFAPSARDARSISFSPYGEKVTSRVRPSATERATASVRSTRAGSWTRSVRARPGPRFRTSAFTPGGGAACRTACATAFGAPS